MVDLNQDLSNAVRHLKNGGTLLYPTDTIWGLGADATNDVAVEKLFQIKNRPFNKNFIVLIGDPRDLIQYLAAPPPNILDIPLQFDTPTTVIYNHGIGFSDLILGENNSVAIRLTKDPFCISLIKRLGKPLVSTSANLSGEPHPSNFSEIDPHIKSAVDYVVRHRQDEATTFPPSQILKLEADGTLKKIR